MVRGLWRCWGCMAGWTGPCGSECDRPAAGGPRTWTPPAALPPRAAAAAAAETADAPERRGRGSRGAVSQGPDWQLCRCSGPRPKGSGRHLRSVGRDHAHVRVRQPARQQLPSHRRHHLRLGGVALASTLILSGHASGTADGDGVVASTACGWVVRVRPRPCSPRTQGMFNTPSRTCAASSRPSGTSTNMTGSSPGPPPALGGSGSGPEGPRCAALTPSSRRPP